MRRKTAHVEQIVEQIGLVSIAFAFRMKAKQSTIVFEKTSEFLRTTNTFLSGKDGQWNFVLGNHPGI